MRAAILMLSMLGPLTLAAAPARADDVPVFLVQYVEVIAAATKSAATALRDARAIGRKDDGNVAFEACAEVDRPTHVELVSLWRDQKAADAYAASAHAKALRDRLERGRAAPFDERTFTWIAGSPAVAPPPSGRAALHVVTHVDVIPPFKDQAAAALKQLAEASLKQAGAVQYQALVQTNRANHFQLLETWTDRSAFAAHVAAAPTRAFRDAIQPGVGSPYDERLCKILP